MILFEKTVMAKALRRGMGKAEVRRRKPTAADVAWVEANVPIPGFRDYLLEECFAGDYQHCCHNLFSIPSLLKDNTNDYYRKITVDYLLIGSGPNGDAVAIDKGAYETIGFIGHEAPRNWKFIAVDKSISDFFWKSWDEEGYPNDFYMAWDIAAKRGKPKGP